jgi:hypothetical protein
MHMEDSQALHNHTKGWPPERGWPLFIAWMGGVLAVALLYAVIPMTGIGYPPVNAGWGDRALWMLPALAGHAWQAWLLFRQYPVRFGLWTALPLIQLLVPNPLRFMQYLGLVIPLLEAAILMNVRRRAWAWILASMAGVVLSVLFTSFAYSAGRSLITNMTNGIGSNLGPFANLLQIGLHRGIWLLGEALCAWVLAWKMPSAPSAPLSEYEPS